MKAQSVQDLGLSEQEMQRIIDGARVAFSHDYGNEMPPGAKGPLGSVAPPRQPTKQRGKIKYVRTAH